MISPTRKRTLAHKWKRLYAEKDREKSPAIALTYETPIARIEAEFAREDEHPRDWVTSESEDALAETQETVRLKLEDHYTPGFLATLDKWQKKALEENLNLNL